MGDVSGVELLMNNHQGHKAEIDARADNFNDCITLGKELLNRSHYASNEIKEKLLELTNMQNEMLHRWEKVGTPSTYSGSLSICQRRCRGRGLVDGSRSLLEV